ncbi:MAG: rhodanese-like domain-containing protein [Fimbriimonadaceae bacterium]|nr:rhodanese-like domain-containing protein [Fimbriimonadaceae bacterium]
MKTITVPELKDRLERHENLQMIDVRSPSEFAAGHIPGAANMPMQEAESRLDDLNRRVPVVLVCQSGTRASMTCSFLADRHPDLIVLEGGTSAWMNAGLPVVATMRTRWSLERQVRLMVGAMVLTGTILSLTVAPGWAYLAMAMGGGLVFASLTDSCPMTALFALMPWNKGVSCSPTAEASR